MSSTCLRLSTTVDPSGKPRTRSVAMPWSLMRLTQSSMASRRDFGSGASSLVSLKHYPIDAIKIDQSFVADLGRDRDGDAICSAIVELAHSLGLCAIAEGVETLDQFAALRALGCELAQGHVFGPARPAAELGARPAATLGVVRAPD